MSLLVLFEQLLASKRHKLLKVWVLPWSSVPQTFDSPGQLELQPLAASDNPPSLVGFGLAFTRFTRMTETKITKFLFA